MKTYKLSMVSFGALLVSFLLMICFVFIPSFREHGLFFLILGALLVSGVIVFFSAKKELSGGIRKFLMLTGGSAMGFFVGVMLHNLLCALATVAADINLIRITANALSAFFFIVSIIVCPILFLIGLIGGLICLKRNV